MSTVAIISIIIGVLGTVGAIMFNFYKLNKISKDNEYKNVINSQRSDIIEFRKIISKLDIKVENLNLTIRELDTALLLSNVVSLSFPFPFWYKSSDGKMRMLNDEYCKKYQRCRDTYIGKSDFEVWDKETAEKFKINDELTLKSQLGYIIDYNSEVKDTLIIKWRIPGITSGENYIAGISIPYNFIQDVRSTNTEQ